MKKFGANPRRPSAGIWAVDVERETDHFVTIEGRKWAKRGEYDCYFDTFGDAKSALMDYAKNELARLEEETNKWKNRIERINDLKEVD